VSPKILSQAGVSLSDLYDVQGSIVGIEELVAREVSLVHEMGQTIFSERLAATSRNEQTAALDENTDFTLDASGPYDDPSRIIGVLCTTDTTNRLSVLSVTMHEAIGGSDMVLYVWDGNEVNVRFFSGSSIVTEIALPGLPAFDRLPVLLPSGQFGRDWKIRAVGRTSGFGAGTVKIRLHTTHLFPQTFGGALSSKGLPVPSW